MARYSEKLKDPRWQKKRLEVLERDGFMCQMCACGEPLQIHHIKYITGLEPWDYDPKFLVALCAWCHASVSGIWLRERKYVWERKIHPVMLPLFKELADRMRFPVVFIENVPQDQLYYDDSYEEYEELDCY